MAFIESGQSFDKEKHRAKMRKLMENMDVHRTTIRIPSHIFHKFQKKLVEDRKKVNSWIVEMVLKYIEK